MNSLTDQQRNALLIMKRQAERIRELEAERNARIAIVGLACRVPGAQDAAAFWELLEEGRDAIREVPSDRWDVDTWYDADPNAAGRMSTRFGGFIDDADTFDA